MGALPWWVVSAVVHSVIFLLATLLTVALPPTQTDSVVITSDVAKKKRPEFDQKKKRDIFRNPNQVEADTRVDKPLVVHEQIEDTTHDETENQMNSQTARGSQDAISDIPLGGVGVTGVVGVGAGGMGGVFGYRGGGGRKRAVKRFGGSEATENAVEAALRWLRRHQDKDGKWLGKDFTEHCQKAGKCDLPGGNAYTQGITGLATLAFLGAGYTHKTGKYRDNVRRALKWTIKQQEKNGRLGGRRFRKQSAPWWTYNHELPALALCEAYAMTRDKELREPAQKAVDYLLSIQSPYSGWGVGRYGDTPGANNGADTTCTAWGVQVLKAARIGGLKVDGKGFQGARAVFDKCTREWGKDKKERSLWTAGYRNNRGISAACTACSLLSYIYMGDRPSEDRCQGMARYIMRHPPVYDPEKHGKSSQQGYYAWYYGSMALFQMGDPYWKKWNKAMKTALVDNQRKGGCADGSWNPVFKWSRAGGGGGGGRIYTTAIGCLTLEVYYRYFPSAHK